MKSKRFNIGAQKRVGKMSAVQLEGKINLLDRSLVIPIDTACDISSKMVSEVNEHTCLIFKELSEKLGLGITKRLTESANAKALKAENIELKEKAKQAAA